MNAATFSMTRRIAWGECDPARIYYTPRVVDYVLEAVESWFEMVLGVSRGGLVQEHGADTLFRRIECTYLRPLVASQVVELRLWVIGMEVSRLAFRVAGEDENGKTCFQAELEACFAARESGAAIPIPRALRRRIENYRAGCGEPLTVMQNRESSGRTEASGGPGEKVAPPTDRLPPEGPLRERLFTRIRRVRYGDCDASGVIHAPRVFDYAVETIGEWFEIVPGISWMDLVCRRRQGAPFVSAGCEYLRPLRPEEVITLGVWVTRLGGASLGFAVTGFDGRGEPCFRAQLDCCFIDREEFRATRIPEEFRRPIEAYMLACAAGNPGELNPEN